ncbi:MAG: hypothetical protein IKD72_02680 [Clostridia bacterium]|nr:hypothetical protein [Clostridia bacterium]
MQAKLFGSGVNGLFGANKRPWFGAEIPAGAQHRSLFSTRVMAAFVLLSLLIVGRLFNDVFCYLFLLAGVALFVLLPIHECIEIMVYILPFAPILRLDLESLSFATYLYFGLLLRMIVFDSRFDRVSFTVFAAFGAFALIISGFGQITSVITLVSGMLLLKKIDNYDINAEATVVAFSAGMCLSSVVALFKDSLPLINKLINVAMMKVDEGDYANRFAGVWGNPNYFTVDIIFLLACLVVILLSKKTRPIYLILFGAMTVFGLMSISKSFLISYALLLFLWFVFAVQKGGIANASKFLLFGVILFGIIYIFAFESINLFLVRFAQDESNATLDSVSTGRYSIWVRYINEVVQNPRVFLIGNGLNSWADVGKGSHNTFLEALYYLGIFGIFLFIYGIKKAFEGLRWSAVLFIPVAILLLRMLAIALLTHDNLWIYFMLLKVLSFSLKPESPAARLEESVQRDWFFGRAHGRKMQWD